MGGKPYAKTQQITGFNHESIDLVPGFRLRCEGKRGLATLGGVFRLPGAMENQTVACGSAEIYDRCGRSAGGRDRRASDSVRKSLCAIIPLLAGGLAGTVGKMPAD